MAQADPASDTLVFETVEQEEKAAGTPEGNAGDSKSCLDKAELGGSSSASGEGS